MSAVERQIAQLNENQSGSCLLTPGVNWFLSGALDLSSRGIAAFAAVNDVFLYDVEQRLWKGMLIGHKDRVNAVSFSPDGCRIASCSNDKSIRVWSVESLGCVFESKWHKTEIFCIRFAGLEREEFLVSGDKKGRLALWRLNETNQDAPFKSICPYKNIPVSVIEAKESRVAAGYSSGALVSFGLESCFSGDIEVLHHDGHSLDVQSISFSQDCLRFCSSARDKLIKVWSIDSPKLLSLFPIPTPSKEDAQSRNRLWISCLWDCVSKDSIIFSDASGALHRYHLDSFKTSNLKSLHSRAVFNLRCNPGFSCTKFLSTSMDRSIALWNVENERSIWHFPCIGGYVYDIKRFGDNEERLVIGAGDNVLRIWSPHNVENPFQMKTIWKGIHAKISVVSPHPALETIIAFGSEDGKIYWFDSRSDRQLTSKSIHKGTVYSLKWKSFGQDSWSLLSIGADSKVMRHDISLETMQVETLDFWRVIRSSNADIAEFDNLKPTDLDFHQDLLCIGFSNGRTGVFDVRTLRNRFLSSQQSKLINQVLWNRSSCQLVFGSGSADGSIAITTFDQDFHHDTIMLREHRDSVISIAWNENFLASCSKDSKILIWDSRSWKVVNSFAVSKGRVLCIEWSRRIPSVLFSGGDDQCVRAWDTRKVSSVETLPVQRPKPKPKAKKESSAQNLVSAVDSYRLLETPLCIEYDRYSDLSHFDCFQSSPLFNLDASPQDYLAEIRSTPTSLRDALFLMGDTRGSIEACLNNSSFSFLHLACSMKAGIPEWLSYSKAFAEKLRASGTLREAGYLFLAIDSLQEAIDCFLDGNYFVEALTAARFRTDLASNGLIRRIIFYWGMAQADNHPLFAAQCFVACNSVSNAIEVLTSSNHLDWWILAWKLSKQKWVANMLQVLLILYQCPQETLRDLALVTDQCVAHFSDFLQQVLSHSESELEHLSYPHASKILTCMIDLKRLNDFQLEPEIRKRLQAVYRALGE